LRGSNDAINWTNISSESDQTFSNLVDKFYYTANTIPYSYYELKLTEFSDDTKPAFLITQWKLFGFS
jgi:hypothetical protein